MKRFICFLRNGHRISLRCRLTEFRPVVEYQVYCRYCGSILERIFTVQYIPADIRRSQLSFTLAKYAPMERVEKFLSRVPLNEYYDASYVQRHGFILKDA